MHTTHLKTKSITMKSHHFFAFTMGLMLMIFAISPTALQSQELDHDPKAIAIDLIAKYDSAHIPGGAVMVIREGGIVFGESFGMANLAYEVPFEWSTPTNIGSTSKQFTAFALLLLQEEGKLSLDDDIRDHIPELPDFGAQVLLRHLIAHTSGYREYLNSIAMSGRFLTDNIRREEIIPLIQRQPSLQNTPGGVYNYNNTGYALLAKVIERVSGEDFPDWMKNHVFEPLGMHNTLVLNNPGQLIRGKAQGYSVGPEHQVVAVPDIYASMGAGGIYSTMEDLKKWIAHFHQPVLGPPDIKEEMMKPYPLNNGEAGNYANGLIVGDLNGLQMVEHGGADAAHRSAFMMFPEIRGAVVVQSNNSRFPSQAMARQLAEAFFADNMELDPASKASLEEGDVFVYDVELFDEIAGRYELEVMPGFVMEFTREEDRLFAQATGQPRFELFASSDSTFYPTVVEASITFHRNEEGEFDAMTLHQNGDHRGVRLTEPAWEPSSEELAEYLGRYFSEELETFYTLALDDEGNMVLRHRRFADLPLRAESKDQYTGGFPIMELTFIRDEAGTLTGFKASSGRSFGIVFEKQ